MGASGCFDPEVFPADTRAVVEALFGVGDDEEVSVFRGFHCAEKAGEPVRFKVLHFVDENRVEDFRIPFSLQEFIAQRSFR